MTATLPASAEVLIALGALFMLALAGDLVGRRTVVPRVTVLLLFGFAIGPGGFDLLTDGVVAMFPALTTIALTMIGFLLGGRLTSRQMVSLGRAVIGLSLSVVLTTAVVVALGLVVIGVPPALALVFGGIATATDPAATVDVIRERGSEGRFSRILEGVVAIDDLWGIVLFSLLLAAAVAFEGTGAPAEQVLHALRDVGFAAALGIGLGLPVALLTGRLADGEPTQAEAIGAVLLTAGLSEWLGVSYILSGVALGITVARVAGHHSRPFHEIEGIEWPFLLLFFFLAGASLEADSLATVGVVSLTFMALRVGGRALGASLGGRIAGLPAAEARDLGMALLPQAGVAIGLALLASQRLPGYAEIILPVVLGTTVIFEIVGPLATRALLARHETAAAGSGYSDSSPGSE